MSIRNWNGAATTAIAGLAVFVMFGFVHRVNAAGASGGNGSQTSTGRRTVTGGVYTTDQASRGRDQYRKRCVLCHLANGQGHRATPVIPGESLEREGDAEAPPIAGEAFLKKWNGQTVKDLFDRLASTMPPGSAGSLKPQEYADVLAYVFEMNKFPTGTQALPSARDELESIAIQTTTGN